MPLLKRPIIPLEKQILREIFVSSTRQVQQWNEIQNSQGFHFCLYEHIEKSREVSQQMGLAEQRCCVKRRFQVVP